MQCIKYLIIVVKYAFIQLSMQVSDESLKRVLQAKQALEESPLDFVTADVPVYERDAVLHPLVAAEGHIGEPFTFSPFHLSVQSTASTIFVIRLWPEAGYTVSTPILKPEASEEEDFYNDLPVVGFRALRAIAVHNSKGANAFALFGEFGEKTKPLGLKRRRVKSEALSMPSEAAASRLLHVVSGIVIAKAMTATHSSRRSKPKD